MFYPTDVFALDHLDHPFVPSHPCWTNTCQSEYSVNLLDRICTLIFMLIVGDFHVINDCLFRSLCRINGYKFVDFPEL